MRDVLNTSRMLTALLLALALGFSALPAQAAKQEETVWDGKVSGRKVVLMAPDVELSLITAGGVSEVRQDWTEQARSGIIGALKDVFQSQLGAELIIDGDAPGVKADAKGVQKLGLTEAARADLLHLHEVVGQSVLLHRDQGQVSFADIFAGSPPPLFPLPSKKKRFDWTLGQETVAPLKQATGADYAMFLFARDSFSSAGRKTAIFLAALMRIQLQAGQQSAFATLVDLNTGNVVWINTIVKGFGDLREAEGATNTVNSLLRTLPEIR